MSDDDDAQPAKVALSTTIPKLRMNMAPRPNDQNAIQSQPGGEINCTFADRVKLLIVRCKMEVALRIEVTAGRDAYRLQRREAG